MADQVITKQELIDAQKDAQALEEVINGPSGELIKTRLGREVYTLASVPQINTMTREEVAAAVAPKANKADVDTALSNLSTTANKFYPTLAEANYYITTMAVNDVVTLGEEANKGLWYKATAGATTLTKSPYDPLTQAKADATQKANDAKSYADNTKTSKETVDNNTGQSQILALSDTEGNVVLHIDDAGSVFLAGETTPLQKQLTVNQIVFNDLSTLVQSQVQDINGDAINIQTPNGDQFIPNLKFSIQDEFARLKSVNRVQSMILGMSDDARVLAGEAMHFADSQINEISNLKVLAPFSETNTIQRIASILKVDSETILFVWGSAVAGYNGDGEGVKLYKKRVKINSDYTVTPLEDRVLIASPVNEIGVAKHPMLGKAASGRIILAYDQRENTGEPYKQYVRFSDDGGVTFTAPTEIPTHPDYAGVITTAVGSTGIILTTKTGRLLLPMYGSGKKCWIVYSDDGGLTWTHGGFTEADSEPTISFDCDGNVLMSTREVASALRKMLARSYDHGETWVSEGLNNDLTSNSCASTLLYDEDFELILHGTPKLSSNLSTRRFKYQIQFSFDNGVTFPVAFQPFDDEYYIGYSQIIKLAKGVYAVAVEGLTYEVGTNSKESSGIYIFNLKEAFQKCR